MQIIGEKNDKGHGDTVKFILDIEILSICSKVAGLQNLSETFDSFKKIGRSSRVPNTNL